MTRPVTGRVALERRRSPGAPAQPTAVRDTSAGAPAESGTARIAVDLLGGDHAPAVVVDGALHACQADPALHLLLVGPIEVAGEILAALAPADRRRVRTLSTPTVTPSFSGSVESSVRAAVLAVVDGAADAIVSAGSTGATVTAAALSLGRWPGVRRPALAAVLPTAAGRLVLLDVGASVDPDAAALGSHAVLGAAYAAVVHGLDAPRIGLLSIGTESGKGDRVRRDTTTLLEGLILPAKARYIGLVEGHDVVLGGLADVAVTDGFTGNVLLKGLEAAYARPGAAMRDAPPRAAVLLGVAGTVVVCHGAATGIDLASGIAYAAELHRRAAVSTLAGLITDGTTDSGTSDHEDFHEH